jgi:hypothetical protein
VLRTISDNIVLCAILTKTPEKMTIEEFNLIGKSKNFTLTFLCFRETRLKTSAE